MPLLLICINVLTFTARAKTLHVLKECEHHGDRHKISMLATLSTLHITSPFNNI